MGYPGSVIFSARLRSVTNFDQPKVVGSRKMHGHPPGAAHFFEAIGASSAMSGNLHFICDSLSDSRRGETMESP